VNAVGGSGSMTTFDTSTMPAPTARRSRTRSHMCVWERDGGMEGGGWVGERELVCVCACVCVCVCMRARVGPRVGM
jgi:hypothetical protein